MALKQIDYGTKEYKQSLQLRYDILRKPLGLEFDPEELSTEKDDIHIAAFDDDKILGCCFLKHVNNSIVRLRQIAVQNNQRGKGIGESLMHFAENIARDRGYKTVVMDARKETWHFFEKLGYKQDGDEFIKITIPHIVMKKKLV
ncbi:MAG: GNAT family N-acetyltransferase [Lacibacter sp.]